MIILESKYLGYISELQKKDFFIWMFRGMYKRRLKKRYDLLLKQKELIEDDAFDIWSKMLLKNI